MLSVVDLGIVRAVETDESGRVAISVTPTYSGCPALRVIEEDIVAAVTAAGWPDVRVRAVYSPAWTTDWMTDAARDKLRQYGIAPPMGNCGSNEHTPQERPIRFVPRVVDKPACPRCGSSHTERLAQFGSTACKALYRCMDCREPFDYFKPY